MKLKASKTIYKTQTNVTSNTAPLAPTIGQQWVDTTEANPTFKEWDGESWTEVNFNIEKVDPETIGGIKSDIQDAVNDINNSKEQIQSALDKSQEAIDKAGLNEENIENMKTDVDTAIKNSSDAISKSEQAIEESQKVSESVENINTNIEDINTNISKVNENIFDLQNEMMTMGENIFPTPTFEIGSLSSFSTTSDNDEKVFITNNDYKEGVKESFVELNKPYKVKNDSDKILRIYGKESGNRDLQQKVEYEFPVYSGQKFNISYDFRKTFANGTVAVGLMLYDKYSGGTIKKWISKVFTENEENWKRVNTLIEVPEGNYKFGKFYVSYQNTKNENVYADFDNIYITRADISQTLVEVNDGKIKTLITEQGKTNQRLETAEGSIQNIENLEGSNTLINTVNGMKQQIQDNKGNIATIEVNVEGIQTQVQDNKQNISEVTQTAEGLETEVSTAKGDISTLKQTAQGLQTKVQDNEKNISTLTQTSSGLRSDIETAKGNISSLQQTAEGLQTTVVNKADSSTVTQLANDISSKVSNEDFDSYKSQTASQISSIVENSVTKTELIQTESSLTEKISSVDGKVATVSKTASDILTTISDPTTGLEATYNKAQSAQGEITEIKNLEGSSSIVQTVNGLNTTVESKADKSSVTQLASQVSTVVESQDSINKQIQTANSNISSLQDFQGKANQRLETVEGNITVIDDKADKNTALIKETSSEIKQSILDLESNTNTQITQVGDKIQAQALQIGPYYPNGSFVDKVYNNWYENTGGSGTTSTMYSSSDYLRLISTTNNAGALLKDYIAIDPNKPIVMNYKAYLSGLYNKCKFKVHEYNSDKNKVKETEYIALDSDHPSTKWKENIKRTFNADKNLKTKYIKIEWIVEAENNEMRVSAIDLSNGQGNLSATLALMPDKIKTEVSELDGKLTTKIEQNSKDINLIASDDSSSSYFRVTADKIYAQSKDFVLDSNIQVGSGFTLSADKIKTKTLSGKNIALDLDTGVYTTTNPSTGQQTLIKDGSIQSKNKTDLVDIGFGTTNGTSGFAIQLKQNNVLTSYMMYSEESFSINTGLKTNDLSNLGIAPNRFNVSLGSFGPKGQYNLMFEKTPGKPGRFSVLNSSSDNLAISLEDGKGGALQTSNGRAKIMANSTNYKQIGQSYQDTYVDGVKVLSVHDDYINITFGNVTRKIGLSKLPDGTPTFFFGTTDGKGGFHFTGGRPYITMGGTTYAFNTQYLTKLTSTYTGE